MPQQFLFQKVILVLPAEENVRDAMANGKDLIEHMNEMSATVNYRVESTHIVMKGMIIHHE